MVYKERVAQNIHENILNKGELSDFAYNTDMVFAKKGSDIKIKVGEILAKKLAIKADLQTQIAYMLTMMPTPPCEDADDYWFGDSKENIIQMCDVVSKIYSWEERNWREDMESNIVPSGTEAAPVGITKESASMCQNFNQLVRNCIEACKEIHTASILLDNFKDNETYMLTLRQLKTLGY